MPKAKPVSLYPLSFDDALKALINVDPATVRIPSKRSGKTARRKLKAKGTAKKETARKP